MIIKTEGNINHFYIQTLCMLFFPGAKFSEKEEETEESTVVSVSLRTSDAGAEAFASIKRGSKVKTGSRFEKYKNGFTSERIEKIAIGVAVFEAGKRFFGSVPPWGILTGVRPAKLAIELLDKGMEPTQVKKLLEKEYFLNPKKSALVTEIAQFEKQVISEYDENCCSVYISIPFCPTRCSYCSFVSYSTKRLLSLIPDYIERLCEDVDRTFSKIRELGLRVVTVYVGGGTPTVLDVPLLTKVLTAVSRNVDVASLKEFTVEAGRPDTVTKEKLDACAAFGVTRVSINPQTLNDEVLREIGRKHTVEDFYRAYDIARQSDIKYINTDLIAGLPGETFSRFAKSVDAILELRPENVTVHTFCVKKAADILRTDSAIYTRGGGDTPKSVSYAQVKCQNAGYLPYYIYRQKNTVGNLENVGFSLPGCEGLYNIFIMEEVHSIFACGAGGMTKLVKTDGKKIMQRYAYPKYPYEYLAMEREKIEEHFKAIDDFYKTKG